MRVVKDSSINIQGIKILNINPAIGILLQSGLVDVIQAGQLHKYAGRLVLMRDLSVVSKTPMEDQVLEWAKRYGVDNSKVEEVYLKSTDNFIGLASVQPDLTPSSNWRWGSGKMLKVIQLVVNVSK